MEQKMEDAGLDLMEYSRNGRYRIRMKPGEEKKHSELLSQLFLESYKEVRAWW